MNKRALVVWGGWDGHQPQEVSTLFAQILREADFDVEVSDSLDAFNDVKVLKNLNLIVPIWTMGTIEAQQEQNVLAAVESGVGLAGCHGGMCDAFRNNTGWQFMTGGQWVAHPGDDGTQYRVRITDNRNPLTEGLDDFDVCSEQYYMHVDPAVKVLAVTSMPVADGPHVPNGTFDMPVVWTKYYGLGKVYYNALGHQANVFDVPEAKELMRRGLVWAARD